MKFRLVVPALLLMLLVAGLWEDDAKAQLKEAAGISARIAPVKSVYQASEPVEFRFTLVNTTGQPLTILTWGTPLEGFNENMFEVVRDGRRVLYLGRVVKRGPPQPEEYKTIPPGDSLSTVVDLARAYAITRATEYTCTFRSILFDAGQEVPAAMARKEVLEPRLLTSSAVSFRLRDTRTMLPAEFDEDLEPPKAKSTAFQGCSNSQQTTVNQALDDAITNTAGSYLALATCPTSKRSSAQRYTKWFGTYTAARYTTVTNNMLAIHNALANKTITFHCDCNENYYAYVYPSKPYHVYLCKLFWSAPSTGTDTKFGTIVHEVSHFTVVAGTDDHAYGQSSCATLATNNPSQAIDNADSYEYFVENNPALTMGLDLVVYLVLAAGVIVLVFWFLRMRGRRAATAPI